MGIAIPTFTNKEQLSVSVAAWLASDDYDHIPDEKYISATEILKSTRQIILSRRAKASNQVGVEDVSGRTSTAFGTAIHNAIEAIWFNPEKRRQALISLGIREATVDRVVINKPVELLEKGDIPVYIEQRVMKPINGWTVGGKYDFVMQGGLEDHKTTSVFTYMHKSNDDKYKMQGSIYRWLNPQIITKEWLTINYFFKDFKAMEKYKTNYPPSDTLAYKIQLESPEWVENFLYTKCAELNELMDAPESNLPLCSPEDLWQGEPTYKYYKNPEKTTRATKASDDFLEVHAKFVEDGQVGIIKEFPGIAKACKYCAGFALCTQKDSLIEQGLYKG